MDGEFAGCRKTARGDGMSEIARCPVCEIGVLSLNRWSEFECPKCSFVCEDHLFPRIAAAMELARAYAWENEVNETRNWMDESCAISEPWEEIIESSIAAERELFAADDAVLEVFK